MKVGANREGSKLTELQSVPIDSTTTKNSEDKTLVTTGGNANETKAAKELATSKMGDANIHAMSVKLQLEASETTLSTISKPANNVQQLGQSANDQGAVVSKQYAMQKDSDSKTEKENESIRKEIAGALNVPEDAPVVEVTKAIVEFQQPKVSKVEPGKNPNVAPNPEVKPKELSVEDVKHNQEIIDAALKYGRKIETIVGGERELKMFTEYVPSPKLGMMDAFIRQGTEMTINGEKIKVTQYFKPGSTSLLGQVHLSIKDGKETVTKVVPGVEGAIGLKVGDTFDVRPDKSSPAGKMPSSLDPQPDGRYGNAANSSNSNNNSNSTQTSSERESGVGRSLDGSSGGSMGFEALGGKSPDGDTSSSTTHFLTDDNGKTWEQSNKGNEYTENPPTQVEVEETATHEKQHQQQTQKEKKEERAKGEKPEVVRPEHEMTHQTDSEKDHGTQAAYGDYADVGVTVPAQHSGSAEHVTKAANNTAHSYKEIRQSAAHIQSSNINANLYKGPYDFGNPADPNMNESPSGENPIQSYQNYIHTTGPDETNMDQGVRLNTIDNLKNTGNPLNNSMNETPAGTPPGTGDAERNDS